MIDWYKKVVLENYANFNGRARRSEYWYYTLANFILAIIAMILDGVLGLGFGKFGYGPIYGLLFLATIIPSIAVAVRRLHDVNKSGWFILLAFVPLANIWLLILLFTEGTKGNNQYGADPKSDFSEISEIGSVQE
ncbi:DUF805 domain-containing protein [Flavobacterium sp.]|uniref:DUF805 domain-containing protein n=1 Tax=Flavobacterium sp. TaxID=239 RepID=UPI003D6B3E31